MKKQKPKLKLKSVRVTSSQTPREKRLAAEVSRLKRQIAIGMDQLDAATALHRRALTLLDRLQADGGVRLPYADFAETQAELREATADGAGD